MSERFRHYEDLKKLARELRSEHLLTTPRVTRSDLRTIYKTTGILRIDLWPPRGRGRSSAFRVIRGAYFNDELGPTVLLPRHLPPEPRIFSMAHELKHHLVDRDEDGFCSATSQDDVREIGAEIFAAELIFPEEDFRREMERAGCPPATCTAEMLVRLKHDTRTTMSYAALVKRAVWCGIAPKGSLEGVRWRRLEASVLGQRSFLRRR